MKYILFFVLFCIPSILFAQNVNDLDIERATIYKLVQKPWGLRLEQVKTITYVYYPSEFWLASTCEINVDFVGPEERLKIRLGLIDFVFWEAIKNKDKDTISKACRGGFGNLNWTNAIPIITDDYEVYQHPLPVFPKKKIQSGIWRPIDRAVIK